MKRKWLAAAFLPFAVWAAIPKPSLTEGIGFSQRVSDREGTLLRLTLSPDEKYRVWTPLDKISPELLRATLEKEDRWFRRHPGFNPFALVRALRLTYGRKSRTVGGSTITMQLARIRYRLRTRTLRGKIAQIFKALQIERHYSKDRILEAYLNLAPYGGNIEGVGAAARVYFGKPAESLSAVEAEILRELPQNPSLRGPLLAKREDSRSASDLPFLAPHFVRRVIEDDHRRSREISTTLDLGLQNLVETQLRSYVETRRAEGIENAAALLVELGDMSVRASVGSADFFSKRISGQVDGTRAPRSPGSTLKPFVYGLAFDHGLIHGETLLKDAPSRFGAYAPENFAGRFEGPVSVRRALLRSRNVPAVLVSSQLENPDFYDFLRSAGVDLPKGRDYYGLAPVLGGTELSMERLASLYGMLASKGRLRTLRTRTEEGPTKGKRVLSEEAAYMVLDILKDVPRPLQGFRREWLRDDSPIYWKTGTSYGFRDAWSAGIVGQYVLVVWLGNFDGADNPALVGATAAAPLFFRIADALRPHLQEKHLLSHDRLASLTEGTVCALSGKKPTEACPHTKRAWVIPGVSPIEPCHVHKVLWVDRRTGKRACRRSQTTRSEIFEFWPSDLLRVFAHAGLPRRRPPEPNAACASASFSQAGARPRITSPDGVSAYALRMQDGGGEGIPLTAVSEADARQLYWFADEGFIGRAKSGEPLLWKPQAGRTVVRVVDEHGRSDSRAVTVTWVR